MDRDFSADALVELEKRWNRPGHLIEIRLDAATVYLTDYFRNVEYGGNVYLAVGYFLGFDGIEETARPQVNRVTVTLSGCDPAKANYATALTQDFLGRQLVIYKLFGRTGGLAPLVEGPIFQGEMDEPFISEDPEAGTSTISVTATNFSDFQQRRGRHTNHEEEQAHFPGDKSYLLATNRQKQVLWGRTA